MTSTNTAGVAKALLGSARPALAKLALTLLGIGLVVVAWQIAASTMRASQVPSPQQVLAAIPRDWAVIPAVYYFNFEQGGISDALAYTAANVLVGVAVGAAIGVAAGIIIAEVRLAQAIIEPLMLVLGTIPLVVLLPFITIWFGTDRFAQSGLVILSAVVTVAVATQSAAKNVGEYYANYARSLGATPLRVLFTVILPAVIPEFVGAVRLALAAGWGWQAVAELLGGNAGVGRVIRNTANIGAVDSIFAVLLCITVLALLIDAVVLLVSRALTDWVVR